jgi:hypothetical protein
MLGAAQREDSVGNVKLTRRIKNNLTVGFEVLMTVSVKVAVF